MERKTAYWPEWQTNRVEFIIDKYGKNFFKEKKMLELGSHNGYIGSRFLELGAKVLAVDGREKNVNSIRRVYPELDVVFSNLDVPDWGFSNFDIIINFGLYYHLQYYHREHLINCINNCKMLFFESVIYDSYEDELCFRSEVGDDQSLSNIGGNPSTLYVENIFNKMNCKYEKIVDSRLNGELHKYDWSDLNSKTLNIWNRRFWIVETMDV